MRPNILFITTHDLGQHLQSYGRQTVVSPNLAKLAERGVQFDNSFCTAPQCSPSRAALHTGRHAHTVGMLGLAHRPFNWRLHTDEKHMARYFQEAGYDTALLGVQHLTRTETVTELGYQFFEKENPVVPASALAEKVEAYLRDSRRQSHPFYLEVGFFEPHRPYDWGGTEPDDTQGVEIPVWLPDSAETRVEFAALQGMIRRMDEAVGRILNALEANNLIDNTLVVFTTDHGLAMPRAKCTAYDVGIETALIMCYPGENVQGGRRFAEMISHVDILPTLLEAADIPIPPHLHGQSFWALLQGQPHSGNEVIFAEKTYHTAYEPIRCIRTKQYKLIANFEVDTLVNVPDDVRNGLIYPQIVNQLTGQRNHIELYDLKADPEENNNLAHDPTRQPIIQELAQKLLAWMEETDDPLLKGAVASPYYAETLARLRQGR